MKITRTKETPKGTEVVVLLAPGEKLVAIRNNSFYRLGEPVSDVVGGHIIEAATEVEWCSVSQAWRT